VAIHVGHIGIDTRTVRGSEVPKSGSSGQTKSLRRLVDVAIQLFHGSVAILSLCNSTPANGSLMGWSAVSVINHCKTVTVP
jgi:hypothetical protein